MNAASLFGRVPPRRPFVVGLVAVLLAADAATAGALVVAALRPRAVVVVPGVPSPRTILPGEADPAMLDAFARLYVAHVDNYTPETVEAMTRRVERWIAPQAATAFAGEARRRIERSTEERIAHQVVLGGSEAAVVDRDGGVFEIRVDATLARYFGDHLGQTVAARHLMHGHETSRGVDQPHEPGLCARRGTHLSAPQSRHEPGDSHQR